MKCARNILLVVVICAGLVVMSGCTADSDALAKLNVGLEILPNTSAYAGKNAEDVSADGRKANLARTAMDKGVAETPEDVKTIADIVF